MIPSIDNKKSLSTLFLKFTPKVRHKTFGLHFISSSDTTFYVYQLQSITFRRGHFSFDPPLVLHRLIIPTQTRPSIIYHSKRLLSIFRTSRVPQPRHVSYHRNKRVSTRLSQTLRFDFLPVANQLS